MTSQLDCVNDIIRAIGNRNERAAFAGSLGNIAARREGRFHAATEYIEIAVRKCQLANILAYRGSVGGRALYGFIDPNLARAVAAAKLDDEFMLVEHQQAA